MDILADRVDRIACGKCGKVINVSTRDPFSDVDCPHCGTRQKVPAVLGSFLLTEQMGAGGMGAVYRALDQSLGRFVAIKVMKQQLGADSELVDSFLREARAAAALNHPNIVQIYSCGQEKGQPYIVMELVGGGRLEQLMENGNKVDEVRLLQVALDVAEGLKAANGANLVHGDIKPANILFDRGGAAKVVDFGLAQFVNRQQEQGGVWGTPYYISPERARGGKADHRSDIYSLGATMFHALTGVPPFEGKTATDVVVARLKGPPPKIRELEPGLQPQTAAVIERMMAADAVLRYPTSASLLADLKAALTTAKEARSSGGHHTKKPKGQGHLVAIGIVVAVVLGLAAFLIYSRVHHTTQLPEPPVLHGLTNGAAAGPAEPVTGPAVTQSVEEAHSIAAQFFSASEEPLLVKSLAGAAGDEPMSAFAALEGLTTNYPPRSPRMMWIRVLQAVPCWLAGQEEQGENGLRAVAAMPIGEPRGHPVYMPQVMATYLIGDLTPARFQSEQTEWPSWYGDMGAGLGGFKAMTDGDLASAAAMFDLYLKSERKEPTWVYALRPTAQVWRDKLDGWEKQRQELVELAQAGKLEQTEAGLEKASAAAPSFVKAMWEPVREQIRLVEEQRAQALRDQEEAKRQLVVQQDYADLKGFLATNTHLTGMAKDYRKAVLQLLKMQPDLKTPEGRQRMQVVREQLDRMDGLKTLLIKEMGANPFRGTGAAAGWEAIGANVLGVRISQSGRVTQLRTWDQLAPRFMVRLVRYYADLPDRSPAEKADLYLSLAIYCVYNDLSSDELFTQILQLANEPGPDAVKQVQRMLPDLAPSP